MELRKVNKDFLIRHRDCLDHLDDLLTDNIYPVGDFDSIEELYSYITEVYRDLESRGIADEDSTVYYTLNSIHDLYSLLEMSRLIPSIITFTSKGLPSVIICKVGELDNLLHLRSRDNGREVAHSNGIL